MSPNLKILIVAWSVTIAVIVSELALWFFGAARHLGIDGIKDGVMYTWGHQVVLNSERFREREFAADKPSDAIRIMVVGDSFTWGSGLAIEDRYTNRLEALLTPRLAPLKIEVLNFGLPGISTITQHDIVQRYAPMLQPDLIIVGFCLNDPQPREQFWSVERKAVDATTIMRIYYAVERTILTPFLPELGFLFHKSLYRSLELLDVIPTWDEALARTYIIESAEWRSFLDALKSIRATSDNLSLPPPVFMILNQSLESGLAKDYRGLVNHTYLEWYRQAATAAAARGFTVADVSNEIAAAPPTLPLRVNVLDSHPSPELNKIYAEKLANVIEPQLKAIIEARHRARDCNSNCVRPALRSSYHEGREGHEG